MLFDQPKLRVRFVVQFSADGPTGNRFVVLSSRMNILTSEALKDIIDELPIVIYQSAEAKEVTYGLVALPKFRF